MTKAILLHLRSLKMRTQNFCFELGVSYLALTYLILAWP